MENPFLKFSNVYKPSIGKFNIELLNGNFYKKEKLQLKISADCSIPYGTHDLKSINCNLYATSEYSNPEKMTVHPIIGAEFLVSTYKDSKNSLEVDASGIYRFDHTFNFEFPFTNTKLVKLGININAIFISGRDGREIPFEAFTSVLPLSYFGN